MGMLRSRLLPLSFCLLIATSVPAQFTTQDMNDGLTAADLVLELLGAGVTTSNETFSGAGAAGGRFTEPTGILGADFKAGVVLSSGSVDACAGPNNADGYSLVTGTAGDPDLNALIPGYSTYDATSLEFDFVPEHPFVVFTYVFASEEYDEYVCSAFNDVFGLFVGTNPRVNYAYLPDGVTPVSINNVNKGNPPCPAKNAQYFRGNDPSDGVPPINIQADGMTIELQFSAPVVPGQVNHIKLAVADAGDRVLDSWIFVKAGSIVSVPEICNGIDDDGDGVIDEGYDPDLDGIASCFDLCPDVPDPDQDPTDANQNGIPDECEELCNGQDDNGNGQVDEGWDLDGDGFASCFDNCPSEFNPTQADGDGDGTGDLCDDLAVELISFTQVPDDGSVTLAWATAMEIDNAGFYLLRRDVASGNTVRVNPGLIPAAGDINEGAEYSYLDDGALNGVEYRYILGDVEIGGLETLHTADATVVPNPATPPLRLVAPSYGADTAPGSRPTFSWEAAVVPGRPLLQISGDPTFADPLARLDLQPGPGAGNLVSHTLTQRQALACEQLAARNAGVVYWRMASIAYGLAVPVSETRRLDYDPVPSIMAPESNRVQKLAGGSQP